MLEEPGNLVRACHIFAVECTSSSHVQGLGLDKDDVALQQLFFLSVGLIVD